MFVDYIHNFSIFIWDYFVCDYFGCFSWTILSGTLLSSDILQFPTLLSGDILQFRNLFSGDIFEIWDSFVRTRVQVYTAIWSNSVTALMLVNFQMDGLSKLLNYRNY